MIDRTRVAAMVMQGFISALPVESKSLQTEALYMPDTLATVCVSYADALLKELHKDDKPSRSYDGPASDWPRL